MTYELLPDHTGIRCLLCGSVSYCANDVRQRYCGRCSRFHEDKILEARWFLREALMALRPDLSHAESNALAEALLLAASPEHAPRGTLPQWSAQWRAAD